MKHRPTNASIRQVRHAIIDDSVAFLVGSILVGLINFIAGIIAVDLFNYTALRQITRIRVKYFQSLMRQEVGWHELAGAQNNCALQITE